MIVKNSVLKNINGKALKAAADPEDPGVAAPDLTVARVLIEACMSPTIDGRPRAAQKNVARYAFAIELYKSATDADLDVSEDMIKELTPSLEAICAPVVGGQLFPLLGVK